MAKFYLLAWASRFKKVRSRIDQGMATVGKNWAMPPEGAPCVLVFGIASEKRKEVADVISSCRCAFAFPYTSWVKQCLFIQHNMPKAAFIVEGDATNPVSPQTHRFLERRGIPILTFSTIQEFLDTSPDIYVDALEKYYPAVLYGKEWNSDRPVIDVVIYFCSSASIMARLIKILPVDNAVFILGEHDGLQKITSLLDDFYIKKVVYICNNRVPPQLVSLLRERSIPSEILSEEVLSAILLTPYREYSAEDDGKPAAVILNDTGCTSIAAQLDGYRLFTLKALPIETLALLSSYTLVWIGRELPEKVRIFAVQQKAPVIQFSENLLSRFGYRKTFATPLFIEPNSLLSGQDGSSAFVKLAGSSELDEPVFLKSAAEFRRQLLDIQAQLIAKDDDGSADIPAVPEEEFVLAIWEAGGGSGSMSCQDFLEDVAAREKKKRVYCLALEESQTVQLSMKLNIALRNRLVFLVHPKDVDILIPHAARIYAHSSSIGFEALLSGKQVWTYGAPWYAGWGLTEDAVAVVRPRSLDIDQLTAIAFLLGTSYYAPYSREKITPKQAVAFWYMRQRQDFARLFEGLQADFGEDPRYLVLDLRANFYNEPELDSEMAELLQGSIFGSVLADFLLFRAEISNFQKLLDLFPHDRAIDIFSHLIIHAYYMLNYEAINFMVNEACRWFDKQEMSATNTKKFYEVYLDGMNRNRFHDSDVPKAPGLQLGDEKNYAAICIVYAKVLLNAFAYDDFLKFLGSSGGFPSSYYLKLIKLLYETSRTTIKEVDIRTRIRLRVRVFRIFERIRLREGAKKIPSNVRMFIFYCLIENRDRMDEWSQKLMPICLENRSFLSEDVKELVFMVVDMLISNNEVMLASTLFARLEPENISSRYASLEKDSSSKWITAERRAASLKSAREKSKKRIITAKGYTERASRSNDYIVFRHFEKTGNIISKSKFPEQIKGVIFVGYYGTFFSAILPVVLNSLQERGYAVYPIFNNHIAVRAPKHAPLSHFAYALPNNTGPLKLDWNIDFSAKRIAALGINFYDCFSETIALLIRRYEFNWKDQDVQRIFYNYLKQTDSALSWCDEMLGTAKLAHLKVGILSQFAYSLPESAIRKFVVERQNDLLHYILYKNIANYDLVHSKANVATKVSAFDMMAYPDRRLSFLPARSCFEPWYEQRRNDPEFSAQIEKIKHDLREETHDSGGGLLDRLRAEKSAGKHIVCCIGRLLFDQALHKEGGPGHDDMGDWLRHSVEIAAETPDLILLVRPHPHEKNPMAAVKARQTMRDILPEELPDNVIYLDPLETNVQALVGLMDLAVLWLGTAAYELTALGEPVALCSYAGYDQSPFDTLFPQNREEYAQLLKKGVYPKPDVEAQDRGAASLLYIKTTNVMKEYPYAYVRGSNSFRTIPYYHLDRLQKYFSEGDPQIESMVDQIVEGFV